MSRFITELDVVLLDDTENDGRGLWMVNSVLIYSSDRANRIITVPAGFITDLASVPRIPLAFWMTGDTAHAAAVVHDFLYSTGQVNRGTADAVLLEAMAVTGIPSWRRYAMYLGVRVFGGSRFKTS